MIEIEINWAAGAWCARLPDGREVAVPNHHIMAALVKPWVAARSHYTTWKRAGTPGWQLVRELWPAEYNQ